MIWPDSVIGRQGGLADSRITRRETAKEDRYKPESSATSNAEVAVPYRFDEYTFLQ